MKIILKPSQLPKKYQISFKNVFKFSKTLTKIEQKLTLLWLCRMQTSKNWLKPRRFMSLRRSKSSSRSRRRLDSSTRRAPTSRRNSSRSSRATRCRKSTRSSGKEAIFVEIFQFYAFRHSK